MLGEGINVNVTLIFSLERYDEVLQAWCAGLETAHPGIGERLLDENPAVIRSIIPGVIRPVRDAKGDIKIHVTVATTNGWKAIALSAGARQELFISTSLSKDQLEQAIGQACGAGE